MVRRSPRWCQCHHLVLVSPSLPPHDAWLGHSDSQLVICVTHGSSPRPTGRGWQGHSSEGFSLWPPILANQSTELCWTEAIVAEELGAGCIHLLSLGKLLGLVINVLVCVLVCVCVYTCAYVCTRVHVCTHVYVCTRVYVCTHVCMYVCTRVCVLVCVCVYTCVCVSVCMCDACVCMCVHIVC